MKYSSQKVNFLDVDITNLYNKPTDTHQFLHSSLCHCTSCNTMQSRRQNQTNMLHGKRTTKSTSKY